MLRYQIVKYTSIGAAVLIVARAWWSFVVETCINNPELVRQWIAFH